MSDTSQGPGWWQASDGKWYAPELYPKDWPRPEQTATAEPAEAETDASESVDEIVLTDTPTAAAAPASDLSTTDLPSADPSGDLAEDAEIPLDVPNATPVTTPPTGGERQEPAVGATSTAPPSAPPTGWSAPDADADDTLVEAMPAVSATDATTVQPAIVPPTSPSTPPSAAPTEATTGWNAPSAPAAPATWDTAAPAAAVAATDTTSPERLGADLPGGLLGLFGAALLIVGSFLDWAVAGGTLVSGSVNGLTGSNGWGTLISGLVIAAMAAMLLAGQRKGWVAGIMVLAAVTALGLAVFSYIDIGSTSDDLPALLLSTDPPVVAEIADGAELDYDLGMWLVLIGAGVSMAASLLALAGRE